MIRTLLRRTLGLCLLGFALFLVAVLSVIMKVGPVAHATVNVDSAGRLQAPRHVYWDKLCELCSRHWHEELPPLEQPRIETAEVTGFSFTGLLDKTKQAAADLEWKVFVEETEKDIKSLSGFFRPVGRHMSYYFYYEHGKPPAAERIRLAAVPR